MLNPLVSIIIGTYNPKRFLLDALDSIFLQSYENMEVILYNDGSNQIESIEYIRLVLNRYPQIRYIHSDDNKGLSYALNACTDLAKGDYIVRMDDDDYSLPNRIQLQYEFLISNQDCDFVGSSAYLFDDVIYGLINMPETPSLKDILQSRAYVHPSIMIKKKVLVDIGKYSTGTNVLRIEDMDLWVRLFAEGKKGKNIITPLLLYRENLSSLSKRTAKFRLREYLYKVSKSIKMRLGVFFITFLTLKSLILILIPQRIYKGIRGRLYRVKSDDYLFSINHLELQIQYIVEKGN